MPMGKGGTPQREHHKPAIRVVEPSLNPERWSGLKAKNMLPRYNRDTTYRNTTRYGRFTSHFGADSIPYPTFRICPPSTSSRGFIVLIVFNSTTVDLACSAQTSS